MADRQFARNMIRTHIDNMDMSPESDSIIELLNSLEGHYALDVIEIYRARRQIGQNAETTSCEQILFIFFCSTEIATIMIRNFDLSRPFIIISLIVQLVINVTCLLIQFFAWKENRNSTIKHLEDFIFLVVPMFAISVVDMLRIFSVQKIYAIQLFIDIFGYGYIFLVWNWDSRNPRQDSPRNVMMIFYVLFMLFVLITNIIHESKTQINGNTALPYLYSISENVLVIEFLHLVLISVRRQVRFNEQGNAGNAGNAENAGNAGNAENAGNAGNEENARNAGNAGNAENPRNVRNAGNAENARNAGNAENAENARNAGNAENAGTVATVATEALIEDRRDTNRRFTIRSTNRRETNPDTLTRPFLIRSRGDNDP